MTSPITQATCPICAQTVRTALSWVIRNGIRECHVHTWAGTCSHYELAEKPNGAGVTITFRRPGE